MATWETEVNGAVSRDFILENTTGCYNYDYTDR